MRPRLQKLAQPQAAGIGDPAPNDIEVRRMISEAAYYRAEKRGFAPGLEDDDWRAAEAEVLARVRAAQSRI